MVTQNEPKVYLVKQPMLETIETFDGFTAEASRAWAAANATREKGVFYFGLYTDEDLAVIRKNRENAKG